MAREQNESEGRMKYYPVIWLITLIGYICIQYIADWQYWGTYVIIVIIAGVAANYEDNTHRN